MDRSTSSSGNNEETNKTSKSGKETFIFGSWKCRNKKKSSSVDVNNPNEIEMMRRNNHQSFDRDQSPYTKRVIDRRSSSSPQPSSQQFTIAQSCLPTTSNCSNGIATIDSRSTNNKKNKRRAISLCNDEDNEDDRYQLHEHDFWCPRCNGKMEEPRLLACLHSVCNRCVVEFMSKDYRGLSRRVRGGCPICDFPLPKYGSDAPPPHYSLQHRLVIYAVRKRLSQRAICCDSCHEEVQAQHHCPTCLNNFCRDCGIEHETNNSTDESSATAPAHRVRPLWEARRIRRVAICLDHPNHQLRYHCLACQRVTCRECMWREQQDGGHRGHASEDAVSAGARARVQLVAALKRARTLLNCLLVEYGRESCDTREEDEKKEELDRETSRARTAFDMSSDRQVRHFLGFWTGRSSKLSFWKCLLSYRDFGGGFFLFLADDINTTRSYHHQRSRSTLSSHSREARERIREFSRLRRARYLIDAILIGEDLLATGSDVEILSLKRLLLKRLKFLGVPVDYSHARFNNDVHSGIYHCCTFCSSGGKKDATCACSGTMPGGYKGCGHGHPGHPGVHHWSCCGSIYRDGICLLPRRCTFKITL